MSTQMNYFSLRYGFAATLTLMAAAVFAEAPLITEAFSAWVADEHQTNMRTFGNDPSYQLAAGLTANRNDHTIEFLAAAVGLKDQSPVEFFVVGRNGKDYESLAVTPVAPSDVHRALEFVGMKAGRPIEPEANRFWPKGERVLMTILRADAGGDAAEEQWIPAESAVLDLRTRKPMPPSGLVFVGSRRTESEDAGAADVYQADVMGNLATTYNDGWTVLDVPYRANQGDVYGSLVPNPNVLFQAGQRLRIRLRPELPKGQARVVDYVLTVRPVVRADGTVTEGFRVELAKGKEQTTVMDGEFPDVLDELDRAIKENKDPFLQVRFEAELPLSAARQCSQFLAPIVARELIRIEPSPDDCYYEAFLPKPEWRTRATRMFQPLEVHVSAGRLRGKFVRVEEEFSDDGKKLRASRYPYSNAADVRALAKKAEDWGTNTVFFFAGLKTPYKAVQSVYTLIRNTFPVAYIFLPESKE